MRPPRTAALALLATALLLTACSSEPGTISPPSSPTSQEQSGDVSEATKGEACEQYRQLSAEVEAADAEAVAMTVSNEDDAQKLTALMSRLSELTEKADQAYSRCYADGTDAQPASTQRPTTQP